MITIDLLKNYPEHIPQLATIWHHVLGKIWAPEISIEKSKEKLLELLNNHDNNEEKLPIAFIALDDETPIGLCILRQNDGIRPDLTPWLGSLVVDSSYQKKGAGKMLIHATVEKAKKLGFDKLYLFAFDPAIPAYYEKLGWSNLTTDEFKGFPVTIMERNI